MNGRPDPTGRTSWVTDGPTWLRRLATLVPPPRSHTTRFHGVFGPAHRWRARIVPAPRIDDGAPACETPHAEDTPGLPPRLGSAAAPRVRRRRHSLSALRRPPPRPGLPHRPSRHHRHPRPPRDPLRPSTARPGPRATPSPRRPSSTWDAEPPPSQPLDERTGLRNGAPTAACSVSCRTFVASGPNVLPPGLTLRRTARHPKAVLFVLSFYPFHAPDDGRGAKRLARGPAYLAQLVRPRHR